MYSIYKKGNERDCNRQEVGQNKYLRERKKLCSSRIFLTPFPIFPFEMMRIDAYDFTESQVQTNIIDS